jgi:excisionase family DNA binding protein
MRAGEASGGGRFLHARPSHYARQSLRIFSRVFRLRPNGLNNGETIMLATAIEPRLLTARQAEVYLSVSARKLWGLKAAGEIPCVKVGRRGLRYDRQQLDAWIDRQQRNKVLTLRQPSETMGE